MGDIEVGLPPLKRAWAARFTAFDRLERVRGVPSDTGQSTLTDRSAHLGSGTTGDRLAQITTNRTRPSEPNARGC